MRRNGSRALDNDEPGVNGLGREPAPPLVDIEDTAVPKTREEFHKILAHGAARALTAASTAKELTDALKVATETFKVLYPDQEKDPSDGYGGKFEQPKPPEGAP